MCGIVGLYGDDFNFFTNKKREYILQGLYIDALRGMESTGMALLNKKTKPEIYKRALPGADYVCTKPALRMTGKLTESFGIIGHNRSSTRGNITDENAHPFQYKHITLVHNGTVYNSSSLTTLKCAADSDVDSAQVAWSFSEVEPDDLLPIMTGPFSLVWWDSRDKTLHFARNDQKPMFWILSADKRTMYYASEMEMVQLLVKRNEIVTTGDYMYTAPGKHYIFKDPNKPEVYESRPFVFPKKQLKQGGGKWQQDQGKQSTAATKESGGSPTSPSTNTQTSPKSSSNTSPGGTVVQIQTDKPEYSKRAIGEITADGTKPHPVTSEPLSKSMVSTITHGISLPHRVSETKKRCAEDGVDFRKVLVAKPHAWRAHQDLTVNGPQVGHMCLTYFSKQREKVLMFQVLNCSLGNWMDKTRMGRVPVKIIGYRESYSKEENVYVVEIDETVFDVMVERANGKKDDALSTVEIGMMRAKYVSVDKFHDLIKPGCHNCGGHEKMDLENAERIAWVGPEEENPICPICAENPQIMTAMLQELVDDSATTTSAQTKH